MRETQSAFIERHPAGCVVVRCRKDIVQTLDYARENVQASMELAGGSRELPLLVNISNVAPLESEVRHFYVSELAVHFTALGLVVEATPLGRMMGNVFFRMMDGVYRRNASRGIPTRLFGDEDGAIAWLTSRGR